MRVNTDHLSLETRGVERQSLYSVSFEDQVFIMKFLRDTLYADKILAVLREYSANAWDEHRDAGIPDVPIEIHLPDGLDLNFRVRDFGRGLSEEDVFGVYTKFGYSTKRTSDDVVGSFGSGSKSGFAYSESWSVTSWHGGKKIIYAAALGEDDRAVMMKMHEEESSEPTGIEISIPVKPHDIHAFKQKAEKLFRFMVPRPKINIHLEESNYEYTCGSGFLSGKGSYGGDWIAIMGCIPYRLDIGQAMELLEEEGLWDLACRLEGGLFFSIGEVDVMGSREELEYKDRTKKAIVRRVRSLVQSYREDLTKKLESPELSKWEKTKAAWMGARLGFRVSKAQSRLLQSEWGLFDDKYLRGNSFQAGSFRNPTGDLTNLQVFLDGTEIVIHDTDKKLSGYGLVNHKHSYVLRPRKGFTPEDVEQEISSRLKEVGIGGFPLGKTSNLTWEDPSTRKKRANTSVRPPNEKHKKECFSLRDKLFSKPAFSRNWDVVTREPQDDDVYVILDRFVPRGRIVENPCSFWDPYGVMFSDRKLAAHLGVPFPEVYGYKDTCKKPINEADCKGVPYKQWRKAFFKKHIPKEWGAWFTAKEKLYVGFNASTLEETYKYLSAKLGRKHPLTLFAYEQRKAHKTLNKANEEAVKAGFSSFNSFCDLYRDCFPKGEAVRKNWDKRWRGITEGYPLFNQSRFGFRVFTDNYTTETYKNHWIEYIKIVDQSRNAPRRTRTWQLKKLPSQGQVSSSSSTGSHTPCRKEPPTTRPSVGLCSRKTRKKSEAC